MRPPSGGDGKDVGSDLAPRRGVLRITHLEGPTAGVLRVEGRLAGAWVNELRETCARVSARVLELQGLQTVDVDGLMLLRQLAVDGVALQHLSGYLSALIADPP